MLIAMNRTIVAMPAILVVFARIALPVRQTRQIHVASTRIPSRDVKELSYQSPQRRRHQ